jgi:hypothetical protein
MKAAKTPQPLANTAEVDAFMQKLDHPMKDVLQALREVILAADSGVGEHIKWNAPSFLYTGEMAPFNPKEYKRYIIVSNFFKQDCIRLVFPSGAKVERYIRHTGRRLRRWAENCTLFSACQMWKPGDLICMQLIKTWLSLLG